MEAEKTGGVVGMLLQAALLVAGIALIVFARYWNRGPAVVASGVFFINLFWITMVLSHDVKLWSVLRNTKAGNVALLAIVLVNLLAIALLALFGDFFKR